MNAPDEFLTAVLGEAEVRVPRHAAVLAYLEREIGHSHFGSPGTRRAAQALVNAIDERATAREIGTVVAGQTYAGLTLHNNAPHRLFLMPGELEEGTWQEATAWAAKQGGGDCVLPSRIDALVLFQNLKKEFKDAWYWTSEPYAHHADYAWVQSFYYGDQFTSRTSFRYRARAVRRVAI